MLCYSILKTADLLHKWGLVQFHSNRTVTNANFPFCRNSKTKIILLLYLKRAGNFMTQAAYGSSCIIILQLMLSGLDKTCLLNYYCFAGMADFKADTFFCHRLNVRETFYIKGFSYLKYYLQRHVCLSIRPCVCPKTSSNSCRRITRCH